MKTERLDTTIAAFWLCIYIYRICMERGREREGEREREREREREVDVVHVVDVGMGIWAAE